MPARWRVQANAERENGSALHSDWYWGTVDHRAPHDAWLISASFEESGTGSREADRAVALRLRLLGAYHDMELEFYYARVFAYTSRCGHVQFGHGDWRYDEFRLDDDGRLVRSSTRSSGWKTKRAEGHDQVRVHEHALTEAEIAVFWRPCRRAGTENQRSGFTKFKAGLYRPRPYSAQAPGETTMVNGFPNDTPDLCVETHLPSRSPASGRKLLEALDTAIERGRRALLADQRDDGSWEDRTDLGPVGPAMHWIVERQFDVLSTEDAEAARRYLLSQQRPDGSFPAFPGALEGSASATALCRAGLIACGLLPSHPALRRAMEFVDEHGGHHAITAGLQQRGDATGLFLLVMDLVDPKFLPSLPPGLALTPFDRLIDRRVHAGNIMVTLVLCAMVNRHVRPAPKGMIAAAARAAEEMRIKSYLFDWQNPGGDWNGQAILTWLMLLGLAATGLTKNDPRIQRALSWLRALRRSDDAGLTVDAMRTDVWSTAWASLALHAAGEDPEGEALTAAQRHLLFSQCRKPMPRVNQRKASAVRVGGWPFQRGNELMPDTDDTGLVLATLGTINGQRLTRELLQATDRAVRWLRDMQSPDGGFAAYVWNLPPKQPGPMYLTDIPLVLDSPARALAFFLNPPPEFSDPPAEGITGRVIWGLGACGVGRDDPAVCRAIEFLQAQQCPSGAWWGRWMACYSAETATTLLGLSAVGEDMRSAYVQRAVRFLVSHQNTDGGFGERAEVYRDPANAGCGSSMPPVTGFVLLGLLATGRVEGSVLERAARYLIESQDRSGLWTNEGWLHTVNPPDSFYSYDLPAKALPLLALCRYREQLRSSSADS